MISRKDFLKSCLVGAAGVAAPLSVIEITDPKKLLADEKKLAKKNKQKVRYAFVVDTHKCVGCGFCVKACKTENDVPYNMPYSRTWVERYLVMKDKSILIDSPKAARDGFTTNKIEIGTGKYKNVNSKDINKAFFVPKLCNQCDNPPCVQVCPVGATFQSPDGIVHVDRTWCIGCAYCIQACPYGVRFFHPKHHVAEKCNFCYHRITKGKKTACVQACPFGARKIGNLLDPNDEVTKIISTERISVLKDEYGTKPQVYYLGLSKEVK